MTTPILDSPVAFSVALDRINLALEIAEDPTATAAGRLGRPYRLDEKRALVFMNMVADAVIGDEAVLEEMRAA